MKKSKLIFLVIILAVTFTLISYVDSLIKINTFTIVWQLLTFGLPVAKNKVLGSTFFKDFPTFFSLFAWALVGLFCYLIYYCIEITYDDIYNFVIVRFLYAHDPNSAKPDILATERRVLIHAVVIGCYLVVAAFLIFFTFPLSLSVLKGNFWSLDLKLLMLIVFVIWLVVFLILGLILAMIKNYLGQEKIKIEHFPEETL